jgi:acyl-ACP thioesterase
VLSHSSLHERLTTYVSPAAVGTHRRLTLPALIRFFQEAALRNTDRLGISSNTLIDRFRLTWVLHRQLLTATRWPGIGEEIRIVTAPTRIERNLVTYRDFHLLDSGGNRIVSATTVWTLMHVNSRRIKPIPAEVRDGLTDWPDPQDCLPPPGKRVRVPEPGGDVLTFRVGFAQLDFNYHLTNPAYVELLLEPLGLDHLTQYLPERIDIEFRREARYGDLITATAQLSADAPLTFGHRLERDDDLLAIMHSSWIMIAPASAPKY